MQRMRILGLALIAVMALSAIGAVAASAAEPELVRAKTKEAVKGEIKGISEGETSVETKSGTKLTCTEAKVKGGKAISTKELSGVKVLFTGCKESTFGGKCTSEGKKLKEGEIETEELKGKIGYISKPAGKETEVGLELWVATATKEKLTAPLTKFECAFGFAKLETIGSVIGIFGKGEHKKATKSLKTEYGKGAEKGLQEITGITGGFMTEAFLECKFNAGAFEKCNQQGKVKVEFAEEVELLA